MVPNNAIVMPLGLGRATGSHPALTLLVGIQIVDWRRRNRVRRGTDDL